MKAEFQTETASSQVVHAVSPVAANSDHIVHKSSSESSGIETAHDEFLRAAVVLTGGSSHSGSADKTASQRHGTLRPRVWRRRRQPGGLSTSSNNLRKRQIEETPRRFLNMEQFEKFIKISVVVVTQMSGSSEKLKNLSLYLLGAIFAVYVMELRVMPSCKVKWKVIVFKIASNSTKLLSFYLLLCILKPEWLSWCGFVIICISATAYTYCDELKTKFTWCCEKGVLVINYVIDKVLKPIRKDQASPASAPTCASV